jgi:hippurate hydrolase
MTITQIKALSEKMDGALEAMLPEMEAIYKDIHRHPELSMQEARTAQLAAGYPAKYNWEVTAGLNAR